QHVFSQTDQFLFIYHVTTTEHDTLSLHDALPIYVEVQLVTGRVAEDDTLVDIATRPLELSDTYEGGRYGYRGDVELEFSGSFGYSVRIVPVHELLAGPTEMGLLTVPQQP